MPIVNEDEDLTKNKETPVGGGTSYIGGGASQAGASSGSTGGPTTQVSGPGTGFNNITNYLSNSDGGARMAGGIAGKADNLGGAAVTSINSFSSGVNDAANAGVPVLDPNSQSAQTYSGPGSYNEGSLGGLSNNAQTDVTAVNKWLNPTNPDGTTPTSAIGVQAQLRDLNGGGGYTQGENALDSAITRSGPGSAVLGGMQNKWGNIGGYLDSAKTGATNAIGAAKKRSDTVTAQWGAAQDAKALKDKTDRQAKDARNKADLDARNKANKPGYIVSNTPISSPSNSGTVTSTIPTAGYTGSLAIQPPADAGTLEYQQPNAIVGRNTRLNDPNNYPFLGQFMINR